jgi:hypothetical protein
MRNVLLSKQVAWRFLFETHEASVSSYTFKCWAWDKFNQGIISQEHFEHASFQEVKTLWNDLNANKIKDEINQGISYHDKKLVLEGGYGKLTS